MITFIALATVAANAKVWTVNNCHGAANFTTLQDAINGATAGDTIYLEASPTNYGAGTLAKKLIIMGTGYWLTENDSTQANKNTSWITQLTFNAGSEGSVATGLYIYYGDFTSQSNWKLVAINADNITLSRNFIKGYAASTTTFEGFSIHVNGNRTGFVIQQNFIEGFNYSYYGPQGAVNCIAFSGIPNNCIIQNNFIRGYTTGNGSSRAIYLSTNNSQNDVRILNKIGRASCRERV